MPDKIEVLDDAALKVLMHEDNSSKYVVDAHHRGIKKIGDLSKIQKLYSLDISFNEIKVIENINTIKELKELKIYNNKLKTSNGLKGNQNLEVLIMSDNEIEEISTEFTSLFMLKTLHLHGNKISRIENLKSCRHLTYIDLSRNRITGAWTTAIQSLVSLEHLDLSDNQISSIGSLENLKKLEELCLSGNNLTSLNGTFPPNLTILRVDRNKIVDLKSLSVLPKLNEFYLQSNLISDVSLIVERLPELESIDLRSNRIRGVADLSSLAKCATLEDLWIRGNPCTLSDSYLTDVLNLLPTVHFIDDLSRKQINESPNPLKLVESASRLPSTGRPATPLLRPQSSSSLRPTSSGSNRPNSSEGPPLIFKPSSRAGSQMKMLTPVEIEKAQNEVRDRLQKLRHLMGKMCGSEKVEEAPKSKPKKTIKTTPSDGKLDSTSPTISDLAVPVEVETKHESETIQFIDKGPTIQPPRNINLPKQTRPKTCEMGTDPIDSIPFRPQTSSSINRREVNNQTSEVLKLDNSIPIDNEGTINPESEQSSKQPISYEDSMKMHLLTELKTTEITLDFNPEITESPRIEPYRQAEQRQRPTKAERKGYRYFRIPESAMRFMQNATSAT